MQFLTESPTRGKRKYNLICKLEQKQPGSQARCSASTGAHLLTVGFGQGCRSHSISCTNVFFMWVQLIQWKCYFGCINSQGQFTSGEAGSQAQVSLAVCWSQICGNNRILWGSHVSLARCALSLSQHPRGHYSQVSTQQVCSCTVKERCLVWWKALHHQNPWVRSTCVSFAWLQVGSGINDANLCSPPSAPAPNQTCECIKCFSRHFEINH